MTGRPPRPLTRDRLLVCILINQLATPGLGSLIARRIVAGTGQLLLALTGFGLIVTWMVRFFYAMMLQQMGKPVPPGPPDWMWDRGLAVFGLSWLWALVTSFGLWRQMRILERQEKDAPG